MRVVEVADEFGFTTAEALEVCDRAGIVAHDGGSDLTDGDLAAFRAFVARGPDRAPAPGPMGAPVPSSTGSFTQSVPLPPTPPAGWAPAPPSTPANVAHVGSGRESYKRRLDSSAVVALVLAFLPLAVLYLGFGGWLAIVLAVPTFVAAANTRHNVNRHHGELRGGTLAYIATVLVVMTAAFAAVWVPLQRTGKVGNTFHGAVNGAVDDAIHGRSPIGVTTTVAPSSTLPNGAPLPPEAPPRPPGDVRVDDCLISTRPNGPVVTSTTLVACEAPHDAEVLMVFDAAQLQSASGIAFPANGQRPTDHQLAEAFKAACASAFHTAADASPMASLLTLIYVVPTDEQWAAGVRPLACALATIDGSQIAGSLAG